MDSTLVELAEFNQWLHRGLGRAVVYLKTHDPKPYREAVLYACTHGLTYDAQCEEGREVFLLDLIRCIGDDEFFRGGLLHALTTEPEDPDKFDLGQAIEIARSFAEKGDGQIKQAMYDAVARAGFEDAGSCYTDLISLEGVKALLVAAEQFPLTIKDDDLLQVNVLITAMEDRDGVEAANQAIMKAEAESPHLAQMLAKSRAYESQFEQREDRARPDYPALRRMIAEKPKALNYYGWGKTASEEELQAAAADLLAEEDEARLLCYLTIFRFQRFPGPVARLLELAQSSNIRIARHSVSVLAQLTNPEIWNLALRFLDTPGKQGDGAELLINNHQPGDFQLIEARLRESMEIDELHHFEMGVRHLVEMHLSSEAEGSLLLLYENGPCSLCRGGIVKYLIALDRLPEWMREECRYDTAGEIRKLVQ